jgi:hypothetical protein
MAKKVTKKVSKKKPTAARGAKAPAKKAGALKYDQSGAPWWKKLM